MRNFNAAYLLSNTVARADSMLDIIATEGRVEIEVYGLFLLQMTKHFRQIRSHFNSTRDRFITKAIRTFILRLLADFKLIRKSNDNDSDLYYLEMNEVMTLRALTNSLNALTY
jgi:hypothetical protein